MTYWKNTWLVLAFLAIACPVDARSWTVCTICPLTSLAAAVSQAAPGDRILVQPGEYRESQIIVDKPLTIIGEDFPVFDARNEEGREILIIAADSVHVEGLTFRNVAKSYLNDLAALRVRRSRHFIIRNNRLDDAFFGIYLEKAADGLVENNEITGYAVDEASSGNAIHAWHCNRIRVAGNRVSGHRDGIYFEFVNNSTIEDNHSEGNVRYGLHFMFSNDDRYTRNTFRENGAGVAVMFSKRIDMVGNRFEKNWGRSAYGLLLKEISGAEIRDNRFRRNTIGINVEGSSRITYQHNRFEDNGWAVRITGGCLANQFTKNNFVRNSLDLVLNGNPNDNTFDGNYWSEYSGYDLDRDGVGDVPHRPIKLFSYVLSRAPEAIVLLRSFFVDLINFSEKVSPVFIPDDVFDNQPAMQPIP